MPIGTVPRDVRALVFGLLQGKVGGSPLPPRDIVRLIKERFGIDLSPKTLSNWKSNLKGEMEKYGITEADIDDAIGRGLAGKGLEVEHSADEDKEEERKLLDLKSAAIADIINYVEKQGFIVTSGLQDMVDLLEQKGMTVLGRDELQIGPQILSWEPIEIDFEAIGMNIATNPIIAWYFALYRKLCEIKGEEPPSLQKFVTDCVIDTMTSRDWWMAVLRGRIR